MKVKSFFMRISKGNLGEENAASFLGQWSLQKNPASRDGAHSDSEGRAKKGIFIYIAMSFNILRPILSRKFLSEARNIT